MKISQKFHSALAAILLILQISGVLALPTLHQRRELVHLSERARQDSGNGPAASSDSDSAWVDVEAPPVAPSSNRQGQGSWYAQPQPGSRRPAGTSSTPATPATPGASSTPTRQPNTLRNTPHPKGSTWYLDSAQPGQEQSSAPPDQPSQSRAPPPAAPRDHKSNGGRTRSPPPYGGTSTQAHRNKKSGLNLRNPDQTDPVHETLDNSPHKDQKGKAGTGKR